MKDLLELIEESGKSRAEICKVAGIPVGTFSSFFLSGKRPMMNRAYYDTLKAFFGVDGITVRGQEFKIIDRPLPVKHDTKSYAEMKALDLVEKMLSGEDNTIVPRIY